MNSATVIIRSKKSVVAALLLSLLLVMYAPMASVTSAQAAADAQKLQTVKQNALKELDRRIGNLKTTLGKMNANVEVDESNLSIQTGFTTTKAVVTTDTKDKVKASIQKYIDKLTVMRDKVENSGKLTDMQSLGKSIDSQYGLDQLANVQGTVTKSVEALTGVFDKLKTASASLQSQVTAIKDCAGDSTSTAACKNVDANAQSVATSAQSQMDNIGGIMTTIGSVLMSVVTLLLSLLSTFGGITGGLGDLGNLGDVSGMGSLGNLGGLLGSFSGIASQLDVANGMSGNAQGLLSNVSSITSQFNF